MGGIESRKPPAAGGPSRAYKVDHGRGHYTDIAGKLEDFREFVFAAHGVKLVGELRADGFFHGMATDEDRHGAKPFRYCIFLDEPQNVFYQDLKRGFSGTWFPEGQAPLDPVEKERLRREHETRRAEREQEIAQRQAKTAEWARVLWRRSIPASPSHPYLERKKVGVHGLRFLPVWERRVYAEDGRYETVRVPDVLLVPMKDASGTLWSLQAIFPQTCPDLGRDKDFLSGGRKRGIFHWIGKRTETVCLAEGYATAASIHEATGYRVFVCFDCGNLPDVAEIVRGLLPDARLVICADHDAPDKNGRRAGQEKAEEAAAQVGGFVALPPEEGMDFNDFAASLREGGCHG